MQLLTKHILFLVLVCATNFSLATTMIPIRGPVKQIKDGKVDIQTKNGPIQLVWKNLPPSRQEQIRKAMSDHKDVDLLVSTDMFAKK